MNGGLRKLLVHRIVHINNFSSKTAVTAKKVEGFKSQLASFFGIRFFFIIRNILLWLLFLLCKKLWINFKQYFNLKNSNKEATPVYIRFYITINSMTAHKRKPAGLLHLFTHLSRLSTILLTIKFLLIHHWYFMSRYINEEVHFLNFSLVVKRIWHCIPFYTSVYKI